MLHIILIAAVFSFAAFLTNIINTLRSMHKKPVAKKKVKVSKTEKPKRKENRGRRAFTERMLIAKYQNTASAQPYMWYRKRGYVIPEWAREASNKYQRDKRKMNLSLAAKTTKPDNNEHKEVHNGNHN